MSSPSVIHSSASRETTGSVKQSRLRTTSLHSAPLSSLPSVKLEAETKSVISDVEEGDLPTSKNPFKIPRDCDIFQLREKEKEQKKLEHEQNKKLKIHEKITYTGRVNAKRAAIRELVSVEENGATTDEAEEGTAAAVKDDTSWKLAMTKDRYVEKESINEYIAKKREMFLLQYSLAVKRDEMRKLDEVAMLEEQKLEKAEQFLENDAAMFDEFLKENDRNSVEAIKNAEMETKLKLEKVSEIKRISAKIVGIKSEISKYEEILKDYKMYKHFLIKMSPKEWQQKYLEKQKESKKAKVAVKKKQKVEEGKKSASSTSAKRADGRTPPAGKESVSFRDTRNSSRSSQKALSGRKQSMKSSEKEDDQAISSDSDEEVELYFQDPQELLDILAELEEQNLSHIQNSQETEETLEEFKQIVTSTQNSMDKEIMALEHQITELNKAIEQEKEKAAELELKSRVFSFGQYKPEDQEEMLNNLNAQVEEVYRTCIGDNDANLSTLLMLTSIETRLEELFESLETMPQERVDAVAKSKEKERRLKFREEKLKLQKQHQEERVRKALERAQADIKKPSGRKLIYRSQPPALKQEENDNQIFADKEKEEQNFFFSF
ncbi:cilia- and flagella-associated protein 100 [Polypterus senegalus]|uniref:cilia- and flagella-associated protein 100 n=1 Tax=Polypterus senegalus TaxID=55291 RepID=UPI0019660E45|nr:cilia- and flagella-associated protein 100 [Polypterus senegalus]XP_039627045.1 cilia- and flagella-associated protein 100 [Polypterus senegalus]